MEFIFNSIIKHNQFTVPMKGNYKTKIYRSSHGTMRLSVSDSTALVHVHKALPQSIACKCIKILYRHYIAKIPDTFTIICNGTLALHVKINGNWNFRSRVLSLPGAKVP